MPKDLNDYKHKINKFRIIGLIITFLVGIYFLIVIKFSSNKTIKIFACAILIITMFTLLIAFTLFDIKRNNLVKKYYGKVNTEDANKSKELLENIGILNNANFDNLLSLDVTNCKNNVKFILQEISKKQKINYKNFNDLVDILNQIRNCSNEDINYNGEVINFLLEVHNLSKNNVVDI